MHLFPPAALLPVWEDTLNVISEIPLMISGQFAKQYLHTYTPAYTYLHMACYGMAWCWHHTESSLKSNCKTCAAGRNVSLKKRKFFCVWMSDEK